MSDSATNTIASFWRGLDKGQVVKWTVYSLLLLNWAYYFVEEIYIASHVLRQGGTFLQWTEEFATTIDEFAWFGLLFMFELETYSLDEALEKPWVKWSIHGMRLVCYVFLMHTVYARVSALVDTHAVQPSTGIGQLCQVADQDISFGENYRYEIVTQENCEQVLSSLDQEREIVLIDWKGDRSPSFQKFLAQRGFKNAKGLEGGIDAWAQTVNTKMSRYDIDEEDEDYRYEDILGDHQ